MNSILTITDENKILEIITDPKYISDNVCIAVEMKGKEPEEVIKRSYLNFDLVMKVFLEHGERLCIAKVTNQLLENAGLSEEDVWDFAIYNSYQSAKIANIAEFIPFPIADAFEMFVGMCNGGRSGASIIFYPAVFYDFCEEYGYKKLYILPSSTEEVVIIPWHADYTVEELEGIVREINSTEVAPTLWLEPAVYIYTKDLNEITQVQL